MAETAQLTKRFEAYIPATLSKSTDGEGKTHYYLNGPVGAGTEDFDEEILSKAGVWRGLTDPKRGHKALGGHVDLEHQYTTSLKKGKPDWDYVVGKGVDWQQDPAAGPILKTELLAGKEQADKVIKHLQAGGECGYSIWGHATKRDENNPKLVLDTIIPWVTVTLQPKNYASKCDFMQVVKSLVTEVENGALDGWTPDGLPSEEPSWLAESVEKAVASALEKSAPEGIHALHHHALKMKADIADMGLPNHRGPEYRCGHRDGMQEALAVHEQHGRQAISALNGNIHAAHKRWEGAADGPEKQRKFGHAVGLSSAQRMIRAHYDDFGHLGKALTTGDGIVGSGDTGGATLRRQSFAEPGEGQSRCEECGKKNKHGRGKCRGCGVTMAGFGADDDEPMEKAAIQTAEGIHPHLMAKLEHHRKQEAAARAEGHSGAADFHHGAVKGMAQAINRIHAAAMPPAYRDGVKQPQESENQAHFGIHTDRMKAREEAYHGGSILHHGMDYGMGQVLDHVNERTAGEVSKSADDVPACPKCGAVMEYGDDGRCNRCRTTEKPVMVAGGKSRVQKGVIRDVDGRTYLVRS